MSNKQTNIHRLYQARAAHSKWLNHIKFLVSGMNIDANTLTPVAQDSEFGKWFYYEAKQFSQFHSSNVLSELEDLLDEMYNIYSKIYAIYFGKRAGLKGFLGLGKSVSSHEMEYAVRCYEDIVLLFDKFKIKFASFERQILALNEEKHALVNVFETAQQSQIHIGIDSDDASDNYYHGPRS